jgi:hypothetical protein
VGPLFGFPIISVGYEINQISCAEEKKVQNKKYWREKMAGAKMTKKIDYLAEFILLI